MKRVLVCVCVLCLAVLLGAGSAHATNILSNPGFESGVLGPWTVGSNFCSSPVPCSAWTVTNAASNSGTYSAVDIGNIELTQTFAAVATSSITDASFALMHPQTANAPTFVEFGYMDGTTSSGTFSNPNTGWNTVDVTSLLAPGEMVDSMSIFGYTPSVSIVLNGLAGSAFTYVDDFQILTAGGSTTTPEPGSLLLLGTGLIGAAGLFRRFVKSE